MSQKIWICSLKKELKMSENKNLIGTIVRKFKKMFNVKDMDVIAESRRPFLEHEELDQFFEPLEDNCLIVLTDPRTDLYDITAEFVRKQDVD